ncbi:hypothetical protein NC653_032595 [Populus alba x Populus x berolinensis]|uniref:Uncharacterized protein n=1 Tax=Populus alba x Populus x berolinensis TaxID=444605 RepID=A0AAD6LRT6_9ROSI|nr:hypothetical protein NC653_032595 [Populus alba x Populus x berolinensis]
MNVPYDREARMHEQKPFSGFIKARGGHEKGGLKQEKKTGGRTLETGGRAAGKLKYTGTKSKGRKGKQKKEQRRGGSVGQPELCHRLHRLADQKAGTFIISGAAGKLKYTGTKSKGRKGKQKKEQRRGGSVGQPELCHRLHRLADQVAAMLGMTKWRLH